MGRRKIEIRAIKDDRNRSVYACLRFTLDGHLLTTLQHLSQTQRRSFQEGARTVGPLLRRRRRHNIRPQQEAVRVLIG